MQVLRETSRCIYSTHGLWSGWTVLSLNLFSFNVSCHFSFAPQCVFVSSLSLPPSVSLHSTRFAETLSYKVSVSALSSLSPTRVGRHNAWFLLHNLHRSPYASCMWSTVFGLVLFKSRVWMHGIYVYIHRERVCVLYTYIETPLYKYRVLCIYLVNVILY